jgi:tetratricopeptide (TPR) repeat protein
MNEEFPLEETLENEEKEAPKPKRHLGRMILLGIAGILLAGTLSGFAGYQVGLQQRQQQEAGLRVYKAAQQYERGLVDMREGNYQQAKQRFIYVAEVDPNYPGIVDQLSRVELALMVTATPTTGTEQQAVVVPSNVKGSEALFNQARDFLAQEQWAAAIEILDRLRQEDINYHTVDVDGMYFIALRNLGVDNMLKNGKLEQGLFNLALAAKYGPIDKDANGYMTWVAMYKTAASYWEIDWDKMVYWMDQVYNMLPGIRDGSNYTSGERLRVGVIYLADDLVERRENCDAEAYYSKAANIRSDPELQTKLATAHDACIASLITPTAPVIVPTIEIIPQETPIVPEGTPLTP